MRPEAETKLKAVKQEAAKQAAAEGKDRDDRVMAKLLNELVGLIPAGMGAYQLAQLGVTASYGFRLFGLFKIETTVTFAVFKVQRPQGACVGWVIIDIYPKTYGSPNMSMLAGIVAAGTLRDAKNSGAEIISQNVIGLAAPGRLADPTGVGDFDTSIGTGHATTL